MKNFLYQIKKGFLTIFGDIKVFPWPLFIVYHPTSFKVKGWHTRKIMDLLQPGDVVMRSYDNYLDGYFIPKGDSQCSHSGVYIGKNEIVHSIAEGSIRDDIIDFCRADRVIILRPNSGQRKAVNHAKKCADDNIPYNFDFEPGKGRYYCHEFTASCFPDLNILQVSRKVFGFNSPQAYLADSFFGNINFKHIYNSDLHRQKDE